jgi:ribonuclease R
VRKVIERGYEFVTGRLVLLDEGLGVRPLRRGLPDAVPLTTAEPELAGAAEPGDWVVVRLLPPGNDRAAVAAEFVRRVAGGSSLAGDLDAIVSEYGLKPPYTAVETAAAAAALPCDVPRQDGEAMTVVTIDPEDAKDFDDGLSLESGPSLDTVIVGVHIADVAAYVGRGSALDTAARERSFTAYLPGRTLPMLPRPLASDQCSLIAGEPRLAHSVFLEISAAESRVLRTWRARTRIRVTRRLSFDQVLRFLEGGAADGWPDAVKRTVRELARLADGLRARRAREEEFLDLALPDVRVRCEGDPPRVVGIERIEANAAHALVEEFMLAANVAVAQELIVQRIPGLFRVHGAPKAHDLVDFRDWARRTLGDKPGDLGHRGTANRFLRRLAATPLRDVVLGAFLCSQQRAVYSATAGLHYGLGKHGYCHFTSPIRRYPDLVVHQQLLAHDLGLLPRDEAECRDLAAHCSTAEVNNDAAHYAAVDRLKLRYVRELAETCADLRYEGIVSRVVADGLVVYVPELGMYGRMARGGLGGETVRSRADRGVLRGVRSGKTYKCGDVIYAQVRRADVVKGTLQLQPVSPRMESRRQARNG